MKPDLHVLAADHGILLTTRALDAGWPPRCLTRALRAQAWTRIRAGAWAAPGRRVDLRTRLLAAQLLTPRLVVSHRSAAALWRIEQLTPLGAGPLEFTDPESSNGTGSGLRVYRTATLTRRETDSHRGLRLTDVPRTLADLLRTGTRDDALVALDSALSRRTVDGVRRAPLTRLAAVVTALDAPVQGAARARSRLTLADPRSGSPVETLARLHMHDAGLHPESQAEVTTPNGSHRYPDFLFRAEGLAVEIEGYAYHGSRADHRRDVARFNELLQCPEIRVLLRYTAQDVLHRPAHVVGQIGAALDRQKTAAEERHQEEHHEPRRTSPRPFVRAVTDHRRGRPAARPEEQQT
ncbi:hypothetical protein ACFWVU_03380 [Streptomyces sp. NPDC058686]|uniref:hypothetical protein n=1 Tax=Streptomyces sp. NPDC058686 TaxID=3346599 RepID=UPI003661DBF5